MDKIWAAVAGFAAVLVGIFGIHRAGKTSAKNEVAAESAKKAMNTQERARKADLEGRNKDKEIRDARIDPTRRDHFSD